MRLRTGHLVARARERIRVAREHDPHAWPEGAVLVMALPLVTCLVLARGHYQLSLRRSVQPQLVPAGQPAVVRLALRKAAK